MKKIINKILAAALCLYTFSAQAQVKPINRIELEYDNSYSMPIPTAFENGNIVTMSISDHAENGLKTWEFISYDKDLGNQQKKNLEIPKKFTPIFSKVSGQYLFIMAYQGVKNPNAMILVYDSKSKEISTTDVLFPEKFRWYNVRYSWGETGVEVIGDHLFLGGYLGKKNPTLFKINWKNGDFKSVPIEVANVKPKKIFISRLLKINGSDEIALVLKIKNKPSQVFMYSESGELLKTVAFEKMKNHYFIDATVSKTSDGEYLIVGSEYLSGVNPYSSYSTTTGLFAAKTDGNGVKSINYINYLDLSNYLDYLPAKEAERIRKIKARKEERGKEFYTNTYIKLHPMITNRDGYILAGEAFIPQYHTETYYNGKTTTTRRVFDGYEYTHTIFIKFDKEGKVIWDNILPMNPPYWPMKVVEFVTLGIKDDYLKVMYTSRDKMYSRTFDIDGSVKNKTESKWMEGNYDGDQIRRSNTSVQYWYEDYFIITGYQRIKNKESDDVKRKRDVFFLSKIRLN